MTREVVWRALLVAVLCLVGAAASAQTIFVHDTFTVGVNQLLESHTPDTGGAWSRTVGASGIIILAASDNARNNGNNDYNIYTNATAAPNAEQVIGITVRFSNPSSNNVADLFGRITTSPLVTSYRARIDAGGGVSLVVISGGVTTTLATGSASISTNTDIEFVLSLKNASKDVYVNGVNIVSSTNNTVTAAGTTGFGMNGVGSGQVTGDNYYAATFAPTAAAYLDATVTRDGTRTLLEWTTAREVRNLGFRVHRADGSVSPVIAGGAFLSSATMLAAGHTYRFVDEHSRRTSRYWIEELDLDGHHTLHGPFAPQRGAIDTRVAASPTLVDLRQRNGVVSERTLQPASFATSSARHRAVDPYTRGLAKQWELAAADGLKITPAADGLLRLTHAELGDVALDTIHLYANGAEVPVLIDGDAIVFYARANNVYWTATSGAAARMATMASPDAPLSTRTSFLATSERRDKMIFAASVLTTDGDGFVGPVVSADATQPTPQVLHLQHIDRSVSSAQVTVEIQGATTGAHRVAVSLNGNAAGEVAFDDSTIGKATFTVPSTQLVDGDNTITLVALNGDADASAVLSAAITFAHTFDADDDLLMAEVDGGRRVSIAGFSTNDVQLYDITATPVRITPASIANGVVTFTAPFSGSRTILALTTNRIAHASSIVRNEPSALHAAAAADMLIVSHPSFVAALAPLAELRRAQGLTVQIAIADDVYDEYGYGVKSADAIRNYFRAKSPHYALLVGDASFDEHNVLGLGDFNFVPTKLVPSALLRTASDTWFTDFDDDGAADVPIGRLPVRTLDEARAIVDKIVRSEPLPASDKVLFVTDSDPSIDFHVATTSLKRAVPSGFSVVDLNLAQTGVVAGRQQLLDAFDDALIVDYVGHGSVEIWSSPSFFTRNDAATLHATRPPLVIALTCLNGYFHDLYTDSLAEALLRAPDGGALAVFASSALTSPEAQVPVNDALLRALLGTPAPRLGDAIVAAQKSSDTPDIRRTFLLFGDPATRLH